MIDLLTPAVLIFLGVAYAYWLGIRDGYSRGHEDGWNQAWESERHNRAHSHED